MANTESSPRRTPGVGLGHLGATVPSPGSCACQNQAFSGRCMAAGRRVFVVCITITVYRWTNRKCYACAFSFLLFFQSALQSFYFCIFMTGTPCQVPSALHMQNLLLWVGLSASCEAFNPSPSSSSSSGSEALSISTQTIRANGRAGIALLTRVYL